MIHKDPDHTTPRTQEALDEFAAELKGFDDRGLSYLRADLKSRKVCRGTWAGCPISYRSGRPGSTRKTREDKKTSIFTVVWDHGFIVESDLLALVDAEIEHRISTGMALRHDPIRDYLLEYERRKLAYAEALMGGTGSEDAESALDKWVEDQICALMQNK